MSETVSQPTILVPIDASDLDAPSEALVELLSPHQLVILGYYPVPDQTATEQAREQFEAEATDATEAAAECDADAVLTAGAVGDVLDRILGGVTDELITQSSDPLLIVRST